MWRWEKAVPVWTFLIACNRFQPPLRRKRGLCCRSVGAQATSAEAATVSVDTVNAAPGQSVTVTVSIAGCDSIKSIMILPEWDESCLELTGAEWLF